MDAATRQQYLEAMGITVWQARDRSAQSPEKQPRDDSLDTRLEQAIQAPPPEVPEVNQVAEPAPQPRVSTPAGDVSSLDWEPLEEQVKSCTACGLCEGRQQAVFGVGDQQARLMVIGEGPGAEEDRQGLPFVGPAGKLLDAMLAAIQFSRSPGKDQQGAYIANVVKCRPPENRDPKPEESAACRAYLHRQIALVKPDLILAVGRIAAQNLLESDQTLGKLRQTQHQLKVDGLGDVPLLVTYHPAYLLRSPGEKRKAWEDLKQARSLLAAAP